MSPNLLWYVDSLTGKFIHLHVEMFFRDSTPCTKFCGIRWRKSCFWDHTAKTVFLKMNAWHNPKENGGKMKLYDWCVFLSLSFKTNSLVLFADILEKWFCLHSLSGRIRSVQWFGIIVTFLSNTISLVRQNDILNISPSF